MPWLQIRINTTAEQAEEMGDALTQLGALSVTFQDASDNPVYEPLPGETRLWGDTNLAALFEENSDINAVISALKQQSLLHEGVYYRLEQVEDKPWERQWMDNFHPMCFGRRLWICPSWRDAPQPDAVNVMLDPGLAFGTGTHPTTALCLNWLDGQDADGKTVIDFGCGSGILAIAALKLGAAQAIGIDIDPQALEASRSNALQNGVSEKLTLCLPQDKPDIKGDIVVANILAGPLRELAPQISSLTRPGGRLALSGILSAQAQSVYQAYCTDFALDPLAEKEGWCRISGIRH